MKPLKKGEKRPEDKISHAIQNMLKIRDWLVKKTHGNEYQFGLPDLYCAHLRYGARWIEVKVRLASGRVSPFTPAQVEFFPQLLAKGIPVHVLVDATESEYQKLFRPSNYHVILMEQM